MTTLYSKMLQVSGPDAAKFLQGQLTCDVNALLDGQKTFGAYCNIKGKVECFFRLRRDNGNYLFLMPEQVLMVTVEELKKYAVFSKVNLDIIAANNDFVDAEQDILNLIPEIYPETIGMFFAHDINLPEIGAVSFTKGCYRGQEIVARMQHRGNLKRHMHVFESNAPDLLPGESVVTEDQQVAGNVVRVIKRPDGTTLGLAVINDAFLPNKLFAAKYEIHLNID